VDTGRFTPPDPHERKQLRAKLGLLQDGLLVIFTGRLVSYKGVAVLVRAFQKVCEGRPDARLVMVGAGGVDIFNCEKEIRDYVRAKGLSDKVLFTGAVRNVDEYLKASDVFAFPTQSEGLPISLLEAMACGLPIVTTWTDGIKNVLVPERNGLVVQAGDENQLRDALERLLRDETLRETLGRAARTTIQDRFTRDVITRQYIALFDECLGEQAFHSPPGKWEA
jgi:glycosyltransferase involved in cell wall biosynthesis